MKGYPRNICKKAKTSLSIINPGDDGLAALCEGVGGETCYPLPHKARRAGRAFCELSQVGDTMQLDTHSARRALQAAILLGNNNIPVDGKPMYEMDAEDMFVGRERTNCQQDQEKRTSDKEECNSIARGRLWDRIYSRFREGTCCFRSRRNK